ncbi:MAG: dihydrolipoyl dehydrogenase [Planctomycetota bacterium]|nr:MAG: dihydrolipoyl dehydrogenase [Planctomycetota bacterium]
MGQLTQEVDLLVIGGGPGGYHAAFRAAQHGIRTTIVDAEPGLGGVCLHRGCIPSKTYLSLAETIHAAKQVKTMGVHFGDPTIDLAAVRKWKQQVLEKLIAGLDMMSKKFGVERIRGRARFEDDRHVSIEGAEVPRIKFRRAIIATGSRSITLKGIQPDSPRVLSSRTALDLEELPKTLLVVGGGYIGLELGQVFAAFGSNVTVVEMTDGLLPGVDRDLVRPLAARLESDFEQICVSTRVTGMKATKSAVEVTFDGKNPPKRKRFARVLVAVGRRPNTENLGLQRAGVQLDERGFIKVDEGFATTASGIYAIGDVIGNPMLAHKAMHEGTVLADRLAGKKAVFEPRAIPAVVFTDPAIAWAGLTESEAKQAGRNVEVKKMPWSASGRAVSLGRTDGLTKLIVDKDGGRLLGVGMTGVHAGEMIAEGVLAMEMGAVPYDLAATIHPHPTLSETIYETASLFGH